MSTTIAIRAEALAKRYAETHALGGVSFEVQQGEILGYLGRNGSGKTTTVRILTTLTSPSSGHASVLGHDVVSAAQEVRRRIGVTLQEAALDHTMTGRGHLELTAGLWGMSRDRAGVRSNDLLELFELSDAADRRISTYSGGMQRRLDIATALLNEPEVLFLDEPTTGLDPQSRRALWAEIRSLRDRGATVFLTTQYLEEADELADRVLILDAGSVVAEGSSEQLKAAHGHATVRLHLEPRTDADALRATVAPQQVSVASDQQTAEISIPADHAAAGVVEVIGSLRDAGIALAGVSVAQPSLEEVFIALTGTAVNAPTADGSSASRDQP